MLYLSSKIKYFYKIYFFTSDEDILEGLSIDAAGTGID
jgi:hypothetical protein